MTPARAFSSSVLLLALAGPAWPGAAVDFRLAQAVQGDVATRVDAYLDVWDAGAEAVTELDAGAVSATLGDRGLVVGRLLPFRESGQGVAYIFAVDVSRSLRAEDFVEIRGALGRWIDGLAAADRAALLTFGDSSRVAVDFTADRAALRTAIDALAPTDGTTVLYRGLLDALELSSRRDRDLPRRRVLIVLSDGVDEGSGLAPEDVVTALRDRGLPLYAVGFGGERRRESLDLLLRFATNSGGRFLAAGSGDFAAAYDTLRAAIDRSWLVELDCAGCPADGASRRLQVNLELGDRVLSKGVELRLLPPLQAGAAPAPAVIPAAVVGPSVAAPAAGGWPTWATWAAVGGAALLAGAAITARRLRARDGGEDDASGDAPVRRRRTRETLSRRERRQIDVPLDAAPMMPPVALCLTIVRGAHEGEEHRFLLGPRGVLGSGGASDLVIAEDGLADEQAELSQEQGGVWARNLSRGKPTLINGVPLAAPKALQSGDLIGNRDFIARVRLG
jgi:hypothetical protein